MGNCGSKDKSFCFIAIVRNKNKEAVINKLKILNELYSNDNFSFYYMDESKIRAS